MRAAVYAGAGGTEVIEFRDLPTPEPGPQQIRVRVRAAGLNRADILQRKGYYPAPPGWPSDIPGLEYAGEVEALGPGVTRWRPGDRVAGLVGGGAHAEDVVVHEDETMEVPAGLSFTEAAAIPEAFLTAYDALVTRGRVQPGERVLIHAVGSGIGTAACQLAKHFGATVLGTSRTASKLERAREYGMDEGILTGRENPPGSPLLVPDSRPINLILDFVGGPGFADNLALLALRGRLVLLGTLAGAKAEVNLSVILRQRLEIIGTVMRSRLLEERAPLVREFAERMLRLFENPTVPEPPALRPVVGATFPMSALARAHEAVEGNETFGKVVLVW